MLSENNQASLPTPFTGLFYVWLITLRDDYRISPAHWLRRSDLQLGARLLPFYNINIRNALSRIASYIAYRVYLFLICLIVIKPRIRCLILYKFQE